MHISFESVTMELQAEGFAALYRLITLRPRGGAGGGLGVRECGFWVAHLARWRYPEQAALYMTGGPTARPGWGAPLENRARKSRSTAAIRDRVPQIRDTAVSMLHLLSCFNPAKGPGLLLRQPVCR